MTIPGSPVPVRRALPLLAVLLAGSLLAACGGSSSDGGEGSAAAPTRTVRVVLDWTPNTNHSGMYLAQARGWYRDAGITVSFVEPGDAGALQLLAAGKADVAVSTQEDLLPARARDLPVQAVAAIIEHNTSSLISPADRGITTAGALPGHTYGGYGGELENALVDALVRCDGGDPSRVRRVEIGEADYRIGFERGDYDTTWVFDGWDGLRLSQLEGVDLDEIHLIDQTDCIPDWYTPLLATSERVIGARPDDLRDFLRVTARGYAAAMASPSAAATALLRAAPDLDPKLVRASARYLATRYADDPAAWGRMRPAIWNGFASFLRSADLIPAEAARPASVSKAWTNAFLPSP